MIKLSVRTTMSLTDKMTGTLQKMMKAMNSTIRAMEQMHTASNRASDMRSLQRARRDIESASASFERLRSSARLAGSEGQTSGNRLRNSLNGVRDSANSATSSVRMLLTNLLGFTTAYLSIQGITNGFSKFTQASDNYSNTNARLANINDGLQTQKELQDKIYRASQRSLSSYNDTASSVAKLNLLAKDAFASNDEALRFTELMNKSFSVSGAGTQEKQAGMYQLTQAMASGRLQGDEFRSIMENAPLLGQAIADATGVGMEGLKDMSSDGEITADIIKKSLFAAATEIEDKFNKMPLTFADAMTVLNNWAQRAFEPLFVRFRQFVNSNAFGTLAGHAMVFINLFVSGLSFVFSILEALYNMIGAIGQFMYDNASLVVPILVILGTIIGTIVAILATKYAILGLIRVATLAWAAAQWVVNAAFLSNPITWVLIAIITVIALVVMAMVMWGEETATVVGFVAGIFAALGAYILNQFINIANFLTIFAEFFINLFIDPVYAVKK
ncbi:phage tape measure protein [Lysinibacillus fusiformis ZB2]|nr:phage tape measure protein [Lysinibacillus fusiformis ZB2]